jgi:hypothetical protein
MQSVTANDLRYYQRQLRNAFYIASLPAGHYVHAATEYTLELRYENCGALLREEREWYQQLAHNENVKALRVSQWEPPENTGFYNALRYNTVIQTLCLDRCTFSLRTFQLLCSALGANKCITHLQIYELDVTCGDKDFADAMGTLIQENEFLTTFEIKGFRTGTGIVAYFVAALQYKNSITKFSLHGVNGAEFTQFPAMLAANTSLVCLDLTQLEWVAHDMDRFFQGMESNQTLKELTLDRTTSLSAESDSWEWLSVRLADMLRKNTTLQILSVKHMATDLLITEPLHYCTILQALIDVPRENLDLFMLHTDLNDGQYADDILYNIPIETQVWLLNRLILPATYNPDIGCERGVCASIQQHWLEWDRIRRHQARQEFFLMCLHPRGQSAVGILSPDMIQRILELDSVLDFGP